MADERQRSEHQKDGSDILPSNEDAVLSSDLPAELFLPSLPSGFARAPTVMVALVDPPKWALPALRPNNGTNVPQIKNRPLDDTLSAYSHDSSTASLPPSRSDHDIQSSLVEKSVAEQSRASEKAYKRRVPRRCVSA